mgnify:CR=1 FL=1
MGQSISKPISRSQREALEILKKLQEEQKKSDSKKKK